MTEAIRHIVVLWDECEHVSPKHLGRLSKIFFKHYVAAFPEGAMTPESPMIMGTKSPILAHLELTSFLHERGFVPYEGENKDLALVKYCSLGLVDQDDRYHFLLDDIRNDRYRRGEPPLLADQAVLVVFITSDQAPGMTKAIEFAQGAVLKTNFSSLRVPKLPSPNDERIAFVGDVVGLELRRCFLGLENDALTLDFARVGEA